MDRESIDELQRWFADGLCRLVKDNFQEEDIWPWVSDLLYVVLYVNERAKFPQKHKIGCFVTEKAKTMPALYRPRTLQLILALSRSILPTNSSMKSQVEGTKMSIR